MTGEVSVRVTSGSALAQTAISAGSGWTVVIPGLVLVGAGAGLAMAPLSATAMAAVPGERAGMAAGALSTFRQLGYAFGIAILGEVFRGGLTDVAGPALAGPLGGGQARAVMARSGETADLVRQAFADGIDLIFAVAATLGVIGALLVFALVRFTARDPAAAEPEKRARDRALGR